MATPAASSQQAAQSALVNAALRELAPFWRSFDPTDMKSGLPRLMAVVWALSRKHGQPSGSLAGRYYLAVRQSFGLPGGQIQFAPTANPAQVRASVGWAAQDLWADPGALRVVERKVEGVVAKLVQDVGRRTIEDTVAADPMARGWARIPEPDACYFCALLATRGAVYHDGSESSGGFKSHDHCRCHAEPIFTAYEPSAQVRQWQADYRRATRGVSGSKEAIKAWRRAYEGRSTSTT